MHPKRVASIKSMSASELSRRRLKVHVSNEVAPEEEVPAKELSETEQDMPDPDQGNGEPTREGDDVDPEPATDESDSNASTLVLGGRRDEDSDGDN